MLRVFRVRRPHAFEHIVAGHDAVTYLPGRGRLPAALFHGLPGRPRYHPGNAKQTQHDIDRRGRAIAHRPEPVIAAFTVALHRALVDIRGAEGQCAELPADDL